MRTKKKALFNIIFLLLVFGLTVYGVFHGEDLGAMTEAIRTSRSEPDHAPCFCVSDKDKVCGS